MLDRLKKIRDSFSEKTKMLIYVGAAVLVFILSCTVPLAFRGEGVEEQLDFRTGERAAMFARYINGDKSIAYKEENEADKSTEALCRSIFEDIYGRTVIDQSTRKTLTEGKVYIRLSDGDRNLRLCRMWIQEQGDWTNWLELYIDAETGFIYSIYISSTCIKNGDNYYDAIDSETGVKSIASQLAKESGFELKLINWSGKTEDTAAAYTALDGEALIWNINYSYYPSSVLDLKISVA